jgi:hypothetical protein
MDDRKIADLTVTEFKALMQECFEADRRHVQHQRNEEWGRQQRRALLQAQEYDQYRKSQP